MNNDAVRQAVMDAIADWLGDAMDCTRVREAWSYGTMSADDFRIIAEDESRLMEIADAAILAIAESIAPVEKPLVPAEDVTSLHDSLCDRSQDPRQMVEIQMTADMSVRKLQESVDVKPLILLRMFKEKGHELYLHTPLNDVPRTVVTNVLGQYGIRPIWTHERLV